MLVRTVQENTAYYLPLQLITSNMSHWLLPALIYKHETQQLTLFAKYLPESPTPTNPELGVVCLTLNPKPLNPIMSP